MNITHFLWKHLVMSFIADKREYK